MTKKQPNTRLIKARMDAGYDKPSSAIEAFGFNPTTYYKHESGERPLTKPAAERYARAFRVDLAWLYLHKSSPENGPIKTIPVVGKVSAGRPQPVETVEMEWALDDGREVVPSAPEYNPEWQYAFEIEGQSLNKIASPGSRIICLDLAASGYSIKDGDLVIVERTMFDGQAIERTAKRIRKTSQGFDLWPESNDPMHQDPIAIVGHDETEEYKVKAVVLWIMKRP